MDKMTAVNIFNQAQKKILPGDEDEPYQLEVLGREPGKVDLELYQASCELIKATDRGEEMQGLDPAKGNRSRYVFTSERNFLPELKESGVNLQL